MNKKLKSKILLWELGQDGSWVKTLWGSPLHRNTPSEQLFMCQVSFITALQVRGETTVHVLSVIIRKVPQKKAGRRAARIPTLLPVPRIHSCLGKEREFGPVLKT